MIGPTLPMSQVHQNHSFADLAWIGICANLVRGEDLFDLRGERTAGSLKTKRISPVNSPYNPNLQKKRTREPPPGFYRPRS